MPVSSYILTLSPGEGAPVAEALAAYGNVMPGELVGDSLPVAVSSETEKEAKAWGEVLAALPGVLRSSLVYHNFEDTLPQD